MVVYTKCPCLKMFPLPTYQKWDCLCILADTFGIGLLLLIDWIIFVKNYAELVM